MFRITRLLLFVILLGTWPVLASAQPVSVKVGEDPPATTGKDLLGEEFSLSDYKDKIVMVYFWGDWCGPCKAMNPQCHALAKHLPEEAFVLIGVNSDRSDREIEKINNQELINWRSFANGGPKGGIAQQWGVRGWPTIVILDTEGKVKFVNPGRGKKLNQVLAEMLEDSSLIMGVEEIFEEVKATTQELKQKKTGKGDR